jgi:hypothetical protein
MEQAVCERGKTEFLKYLWFPNWSLGTRIKNSKNKWNFLLLY